jgi:hypothetical protein
MHLCMSALCWGVKCRISERKSSTYRDMERVKGIEPSYEAWEAAVLPLNYTRIALDYLTIDPAHAGRTVAAAAPAVATVALVVAQRCASKTAQRRVIMNAATGGPHLCPRRQQRSRSEWTRETMLRHGESPTELHDRPRSSRAAHRRCCRRRCAV